MVENLPPKQSDERLTPIAMPPPQKTHGGRKRADLFDRLVVFLCAALSVLVLIAAVMFFIGFAENDSGFWHLFSALALSICLATLVWFPLLVIGYMAKEQVKNRHKLTASEAFLGVVLTLPWVVAGTLLVPLGGLARAGGITALLASGVFLLWIFSRSRPPTAKSLEKKQ